MPLYHAVHDSNALAKKYFYPGHIVGMEGMRSYGFFDRPRYRAREVLRASLCVSSEDLDRIHRKLDLTDKIDLHA